KGDWTSRGHSGGAYEKVIRWAFEKQGLFQPPGASTPVIKAGAPPDVDVYIDDGRGGEYCYQPDYSVCPAIWNRRANDGNNTHEAPAPGAVNFAFVKIKNRGSQPATSVVVNAFQNSSPALNYPNDWQPMLTPQLPTADVPPQSPEITIG